MKLNSILRRLIVSILCAAMVISIVPVTVFANKEKNDTAEPEPTIAVTTSKPSYILQIVTGEDGYAGSGGSFTITYTDSKGNAGQKLTVDFQEGYKTLFPDHAFSRSDNVYKNITSNYRFGANSMNAYEVNSIAQYYTGSYYSSNSFALTPYSSCTFSLGGLPADLKEITAVGVTLASNDSLSMQSLRIIKLTSWSITNGNCLSSYMSGTLSNQMEGLWYGELAAKASGTCNGQTTTTFSTSNRKLTWYASNRTKLDNQGDSKAFSMHFADSPTAGIETMMAGRNDDEIQEYFFGDNYSTEDFKKMGNSAYLAYSNLNPIFKECLTLELTYLDTLGDTRKIEIPVVTSYLINILVDNNGQLCGYSDTTWISGILQQNETIGLALQLAQYQSLVGLQLTYGKAPDGMSTRENARVVDTTNDTIAVDNLCFYNSTADFKMKYSTQHLTCPLNTSQTPAYSYTSPNSDGSKLSTGYKLRATVENGMLVDGAPSKKELKDTYVITLNNSSVENAGTYSGIYMDITYMDINGFEHTLEDLSLNELVGEFYGYSCNHDVLLWKQSNTKTGYYIGDATLDCYMQYWEHLRHPGTTTMFKISAANVAYFTSISFSIQSNKTQQEIFLSGSDTGIDSWQLDSVSVNKVTSIGQRYSVKGRVQRPDSWYGTAFPLWSRDITGTEVAWSNQKMLLQSGILSQTIFLNYVDQDGTVVKPDQSIKENTDYLDKLPTSMTYHDTLKDLGLAIPKCTYQITVDVADVADAGSTNFFYFQLIFENGTSGVVLANQQLSSDSFRRGQEETFLIQTTQNYGKLKSVRIICDNASSTSNVFDKLNINMIKVKLDSSTGVSRFWLIENVGWIDINYADEGADSYYDGSGVIVPAETANVQLVREYAVTGITTGVDLLFCISTAHGSTLSIANLNSTSWADGYVYANLVYLDSTGTRKEYSFDLTNQLQLFNGTDELKWMYRPNHVDRFVLSMSDISKIISLEITRSDGRNEEWLIDGISVQQVGGASGVYISYNAEYIKDFQTATDLANSVQSGAVTIYGQGSHVFDFTDNTIIIDKSDDDSWDATISREPDTTNDTLNVYLYSGSLLNVNYPFNGNTAIKASVTYTTRFNAAMQTSFTFQRGTCGGKQVMYAEGINVSDMSTLNSMSLSDQSSHSYSTVVAHAVIERVRDGVIINTYRLDYGNFLEHSSKSTPSTAAVSPMRQKVTLLSAAGQDNIPLTAESYDVAVALRYTSIHSMDGQKKVFQSPYIYLTDQQITMLSSNQNVELEFHVGGIDQIVGLSVISTGPVFQYDGATVQNFDGQNNNLLGSFNADSVFSASAVETIVPLSVGNTSTAVFTFITPPNTTVAGAGTRGQVSMMITYTNSAGETMTRIVDDLISRLPTGTSITAGTTTELTLLLPDAVSIETVTLYAPDDDWYVSNIGVILTQSDGTVTQKTRRPNGWVKMLEPLEVDMNAQDNLILGLTVNAASQKLGTTVSSSNAYLVINTQRGDTVSLIPFISYSGTPDTSCIWNSGIWADYCVIDPSGSMVFHVPDTAQEGDSYQLTVTATADPTVSVSVMICVISESFTSGVTVFCQAQSADKAVVGTPANGAQLQVFSNDIISIEPFYAGSSLSSSQWTWDLDSAVGTTSVNETGKLVWSLDGTLAAGTRMTIGLKHTETAAQTSIEVVIIPIQAADINVTATATGTNQTVNGTAEKAIAIDAYVDDLIYLTPCAGKSTLASSAWSWSDAPTGLLVQTGANGQVAVSFSDTVFVGASFQMKVTHPESGAQISITINIVAREMTADSISVEATVDGSGDPVTGIAGTTVTVEAEQNQIITVNPYANGEAAGSSSWIWDLADAGDYITEGSNGSIILTPTNALRDGAVFTLTLTHRATNHKITVKLVIKEYDSAKGVKTLDSYIKYYNNAPSRIDPGQTVYLNATTSNYVNIYPMSDGMTTSKSDWIYTCDKDFMVENFVSDDGCLNNHPIWTLFLEAGDTITYTVTHVKTGESFTVVVTIVEST